MSRHNNLISRFTRMVSVIERTIDHTKHPGMNRTCVRSPDCFQITNIAGGLLARAGSQELAVVTTLAGTCLAPLLSGRGRLLEAPRLSGRSNG